MKIADYHALFTTDYCRHDKTTCIENAVKTDVADGHVTESFCLCLKLITVLGRSWCESTMMNTILLSLDIICSENE